MPRREDSASRSRVPAEDETPSARISPRRKNSRFGILGVVLSLAALAVFWRAEIFLGIWTLGAGFSAIALTRRRARRELGFFGLAVSVVSFAGFFTFLIEPRLLERNFLRPEIASAAATDASAVPATGGETRVPAGEEISAGDATPAPDSAAGDSRARAGDGTAPAVSRTPAAASGSAPRTPSAGTPPSSEKIIPPLPVSAFDRISRHRAIWPRSVRLSRDREITLWDEEARVFMGRMTVPAGTRVEVLEVRADGSLRVLDRTGQKFILLAADTDFAEKYIEKNPN